MKAYLLYPDREFNKEQGYEYKSDIVKDLNLDVLFRIASREPVKEEDVRKPAKEDPYIQEVMKKIMLVPLRTKSEVEYRQHILSEALNREEIFRKLYQISSQACEDIKQHRENEKERQIKYLEGKGSLVTTFELLCRIVDHLEILSAYLKEIQTELTCTQMKQFIERFHQQYSPEFSDLLKDTLHDMGGFVSGGAFTYSVTLGAGMKQNQLMIHEIENLGYQKKRKNSATVQFLQKILKSNVIQMKEDDLLQEAKEMETAFFSHLLSYFNDFLKENIEFFQQFHLQCAFYVGCCNLSSKMKRFGLNHCMPEVIENKKELSFSGLYELSMAMLMQHLPTTNSLAAEDDWLFIITGANQGGKSTYLRSIGIAQIFMQCGMFVPAQSYRSALYDYLFTHFTRREDSTMSSGRLDEELKRMDGIVKLMTKDSMVLLNESFATTTEKEGSLIANDLTLALYEAGITICMVTHLLQFANNMYQKNLSHAVFLSAQRKENGERTFKMIETTPSATSFGLDLYDEIVPKLD